MADPRARAAALQAAVDLRAVLARLLRRIREAGADETLTPAQASALARLSKGGVLTVSALAAVEKVRPQSMAATVEALELAGYLVRTQDPSDGRRQIIDLTESGWDRVQGARAAGAAWLEQRFAEELDEEDVAVVARAVKVLERLLA